MREIIYKIHNVMDMIKGCHVGYTSRNDKELILNVKGQNYKLTIQKLEDGELTNDIVEKYL